MVWLSPDIKVLILKPIVSKKWGIKVFTFKCKKFQNIYSNLFKVEDIYNICPLLAAIWENHVSCVELMVKKVSEN